MCRILFSFVFVTMLTSDAYAFVYGLRPVKLTENKERKELKLKILDLEGTIEEFSGRHSVSRYPTISMKELYSLFQGIGRDKDNRQIALRIGTLNFRNISDAFEIANQIDRLRKEGYRFDCFVEEAGQFSYVVASSCDSITVSSGSSFYFTGIPLRVFLLKGYLEQIGIDVMVYKAGKYKGGDQLTNKYDISDEFREELEDLAGDWYRSLKKMIARGREISDKELENIFNSVIIPAKEAVKLKMVDAIKPRDVWLSDLEEKIKTGKKDTVVVVDNLIKEGKSVTIADLFALFASSLGSWEVIKPGDPDSKIAVLYANGVIVDGKSNMPVSSMVFSEDYREIIGKIVEDKTIKAVVLRVNSPGGSASASRSIYKSLKGLSSKKPLVVSMGQYAASGGYYISCAAETIFADENTLTGSIGVIAAYPVMQYYYMFHGVKPVFIGKGKGAELYDDSQPPSDNIEAVLNGHISSIYDEFTLMVAHARKMNIGEVRRLAEGRIYSGTSAKACGLVDRMGGLNDAVLYAARLADIEGLDYSIVSFPKSPSFSMDNRRFGRDGFKNEAKLDGFSGDMGGILIDLIAGSKVKILTVMPYEIMIK